ncbi:alpha-hydroxy acid oxidase [Micromonospora sp. WMMD1120]|nr:alpha-hydroxy acid oxidase [Micromonospora sp. WMMD1120]MDG4810819.1 alpha-hydroxy acid oxidase [Micromonospora sp. WMMD1120]
MTKLYPIPEPGTAASGGAGPRSVGQPDEPTDRGGRTAGPADLSSIVSVAQAEAEAMLRTPADVWDYLAGGSGQEVTLRANRTALDALAVVPRVLAGVRERSLDCRLVDADARMPVAVAPIAYQKLFHPHGELAVARAAAVAGVPYVVSLLSSTPLEDLAACGGSLWLQLYWLKDRDRMTDLLRRAEAVGCEALVVSVDMPAMGRRVRDLRRGFTLPAGVRAAHFDQQAPTNLTAGASSISAHTAAAFDPSFSWADLARLAGSTRLPLVVKGVLDVQDARQAAHVGAAAIVVSNHGGRQLDGAPASIEVLPAIVDALDDSAQVLIDGGIRSGNDVLKALALGAHGVLLGRPVCWGLALGGESGVTHVLSLLRDEFDNAMALAGCADPSSIRQLRTLAAAARPGGGR